VAGRTHAGVSDAAKAADHADWSQCRLDQREPQFGIEEERLVAEELEIVVAAQFGVAAEVHVARELSPALEPARAERQHAISREAEIVARVDVGRLPRQETADRRRV